MALPATSVLYTYFMLLGLNGTYLSHSLARAYVIRLLFCHVNHNQASSVSLGRRSSAARVHWYFLSAFLISIHLRDIFRSADGV